MLAFDCCCSIPNAPLVLMMATISELIMRGTSRATPTHLSLIREQFSRNGLEIEVRYYRQPASIAAVLVDDDLAAMGWYRYYPDPDATRATVHLRGHNTPGLIVDGVEARTLREFARDHFSSMWECAEVTELAESAARRWPHSITLTPLYYR